MKRTWFHSIGNLWQSRRPYALVHCGDNHCYLGLESLSYTVYRTKQFRTGKHYQREEIDQTLIYFALVAERKLHCHPLLGQKPSTRERKVHAGKRPTVVITAVVLSSHGGHANAEVQAEPDHE